MHNPHHAQDKRRQDTTHHPQAKRQCTSTTHAIPHHKRLLSSAESTPNDQPPQKKQQTGPHFRLHDTRGTYHHAALKRPHDTLDDHSSPASPPTRHRSISRTPRTCTRPCPRRSQYVHDPTDDRDTASSPGLGNSTADQGDNTPDAQNNTMTTTPSPAPNAPPPPPNVGRTPPHSRGAATAAIGANHYGDTPPPKHAKRHTRIPHSSTHPHGGLKGALSATTPPPPTHRHRRHHPACKPNAPKARLKYTHRLKQPPLYTMSSTDTSTRRTTNNVS